MMTPSMPKIDMLRHTLQSLQAHAAGMHASAQMALQLLSEMGAGEPSKRPERGEMYNGRPAVHYGDMARHIEQVESSGGRPAQPAPSGEPSAQE